MTGRALVTGSSGLLGHCLVTTLHARGVPATRLERIVCPIGRGETPSLRGKEPGTIALATAAEIAAARDLARSARSGRGLAPRVEQETTPMPAARTR